MSRSPLSVFTYFAGGGFQPILAKSSDIRHTEELPFDNHQLHPQSGYTSFAISDLRTTAAPTNGTPERDTAPNEPPNVEATLRRKDDDGEGD
jgi:hypothetical protein